MLSTRARTAAVSLFNLLMPTSSRLQRQAGPRSPHSLRSTYDQRQSAPATSFSGQLLAKSRRASDSGELVQTAVSAAPRQNKCETDTMTIRLCCYCYPRPCKLGTDSCSWHVADRLARRTEWQGQKPKQCVLQQQEALCSFLQHWRHTMDCRKATKHDSTRRPAKSY